MPKNKNNTISEVLEEFDEMTKFLEIRKGDGMQILPIEEDDRDNLKNFLKQKLQQVEQRKVENIGNRVECASFSEEPDFECGRVLPISEMMSTVKNPDTFYCKECYQRGVDMENEAMGL